MISNLAQLLVNTHTQLKMLIRPLTVALAFLFPINCDKYGKSSRKEELHYIYFKGEYTSVYGQMTNMHDPTFGTLIEVLFSL